MRDAACSSSPAALPGFVCVSNTHQNWACLIIWPREVKGSLTKPSTVPVRNCLACPSFYVFSPVKSTCRHHCCRIGELATQNSENQCKTRISCHEKRRSRAALLILKVLPGMYIVPSPHIYTQRLKCRHPQDLGHATFCRTPTSS